MNNRQPLKQLRFKSQNTIKQLSNGFRKYEPNGSAESYFVDVLLEICCKEVQLKLSNANFSVPQSITVEFGSFARLSDMRNIPIRYVQRVTHIGQFQFTSVSGKLPCSPAKPGQNSRGSGQLRRVANVIIIKNDLRQSIITVKPLLHLSLADMRNTTIV